LAAQSLVALIFILAAIQAVIFGSAYHGPDQSNPAAGLF